MYLALLKLNKVDMKQSFRRILKQPWEFPEIQRNFKVQYRTTIGMSRLKYNSNWSGCSHLNQQIIFERLATRNYLVKISKV